MTCSRFRFVSLLLFASYKAASPFTVQPVAFQQRQQEEQASMVIFKAAAADEHLAHGIGEVHEENDAELLESERAAVEDAYDISDSGMEAAAEERAVMLAHEMIHEMKHRKKQAATETSDDKWIEEHLAHDISEIHEETNAELLESERAAVEDAHDISDAGMEAAAEERAVMLANELIHEMREKALKKKADKKDPDQKKKFGF
jgi:hypothetical protein